MPFLDNLEFMKDCIWIWFSLAISVTLTLQIQKEGRLDLFFFFEIRLYSNQARAKVVKTGHS